MISHESHNLNEQNWTITLLFSTSRDESKYAGVDRGRRGRLREHVRAMRLLRVYAARGGCAARAARRRQ